MVLHLFSSLDFGTESHRAQADGGGTAPERGAAAGYYRKLPGHHLRAGSRSALHLGIQPDIPIICVRCTWQDRLGITAARPGTACLLYTSPSPRDGLLSRMPS